MKYMKYIVFISGLVCLSSLPNLTFAQSGGSFEIKQSVIANGGGSGTGGTFSPDGTIGQAIAETNAIGGGTFSLRSGFWTTAQFAPTAAVANLSGRVIVEGASGKGIRNARLSLTNAATGEVFTARSGTFGAYRFEDVPVGQSYILTVSARRFSFSQNTRFITLLEELTDVDFVGAEQF